MTPEQMRLMWIALWCAAGLCVFIAMLGLILKSREKWDTPWWQVWSSVGLILVASLVLGAWGYQQRSLYYGELQNQRLQEQVDEYEDLKDEFIEVHEEYMNQYHENETRKEVINGNAEE